MTAKKAFPPRSKEKFLLESDEEFPLDSDEFELDSDETIRLNHDDDRFMGLEQEIFRALFWDPHDIDITIEKDTLKSIVKLDKSLKSIKTRTAKELKGDVDLAGGLRSYWKRVELNDSSERFSDGDGFTYFWAFNIVHRANSVVLANILKILQRESDFDEWLSAGINIAGSDENGSLFSEVESWVLPEALELLLSSGANAEHGYRPSRQYVRLKGNFLAMFHVFLKLLPKTYSLGTYGNGSTGFQGRSVFPRELLKVGSLFITPDAIQKPSITWIHFSRNNILFMMATIRTFGWHAALNFYGALQALKRNSTDPLLTHLESSYQSKPLRLPFEQGIFNHYGSCEADFSIIVFPCLVLTTIGRQKVRRKEHEDLKTRLKPYKDLLSHDHLERTLDEAYYPGLSCEALQVRNRDQVVTHSTDNFTSYNAREGGREEIGERAFILMVPQLWLYKLGNVVVSAYSMSSGLTYAIYDDLVGMSSQECLLRSANIHFGFIITSAIDRFSKGYINYEDEVEYPPPLDLFETRVVQILSEVRSYIEPPTGEKSSSSGLEYRRERYFIHVISDVRSELAMIQHVLEQQEHILKQFLKDCAPASREQHIPGWERIKASQETIQEYMRRVKKIDGDADRIEKSIQDMLNLKRTHASIRDAHNSLILSTAVIGFTVITIVFTPLAFLTALFALKIDGFEKLQISGSDGVFHSGKIGGIFVSTEILTLALTGIAVWLAFKYINRDQERSLKERMVAWLEGFVMRRMSALIWPITLILWSKGTTKTPDLESLRQVELQGATANSSDNPSPATAARRASTG